ncbi:hypothetical protein E5D57_011228 [Metarhizium anisopliae]|nr:hypothetical protein E5D57_011228 [Metarhizium anisopliae]
MATTATKPDTLDALDAMVARGQHRRRLRCQVAQVSPLSRSKSWTAASAGLEKAKWIKARLGAQKRLAVLRKAIKSNVEG